MSSEMVFCRACGKELHRTAAACPHCGATRRTRGYKNKTVAALLAFFVGGLGVHRFYLGQWWGIFYLLFCWTLIPGFVAFIEFIVFLVCDQQGWDEKYNEGIPSDSSGSSGAVVAIVVAVAALFGIFVIGVLAAIAIPAYQDYTIRAQATEAFVAADGLRQAMADARRNNDNLQDLSEITSELARESQYLEYVRVAPGGAMTIAFNANAAAAIRGQTVIFEPQDAEGQAPWDCTGGTLAAKYRPSRCRR